MKRSTVSSLNRIHFSEHNVSIPELTGARLGGDLVAIVRGVGHRLCVRSAATAGELSTGDPPPPELSRSATARA